MFNLLPLLDVIYASVPFTHANVLSNIFIFANLGLLFSSKKWSITMVLIRLLLV